MATVQDWKDRITPLLVGIDRHNPDNVPILQEYLLFQVTSKNYDFEANLTLMKLYQFHVDLFDAKCVAMAMLKSLMQLPENHFTMLKYIVPITQQVDEELKPVFDMYKMLESCEFKKFWSFYSEQLELVNGIIGLTEAVQTYIAGLLNNTYQSIDKSFLLEYLGFRNDDELKVFAVKQGWTDKGQQYFLLNKEDVIKPKKIISKIEFDSVAAILSTDD